MAIIGKPLCAGGGGIDETNTLYAAVIGTVNSSNFVVVGSSGTNRHVEDSDYFTYSSGVFTCQKAGNYTFRLSVRGGYNNGGATLFVQYYLRKRVGSTVTSIASQTSNLNATSGTTRTATATLAVGDEVYMQLKYAVGAYQSGGAVEGGFMISE